MISLVSGSFEAYNGSIIHFVACSEKECVHNSDGHCMHRQPQMMKAYYGQYPDCLTMPESIICNSREIKPKEDSKMSDIKITYKPVDKKAKAKKAIDHGLNLGMLTANIADKIDAIYNGKEEDGEILTASIRHGDIMLEAWSSSLKQIRIRLSHDVPNTPGMLEYFSKQEMREFAQALVKMSEQ